MTMRISVSGDNFGELRHSGAYYVDKTELMNAL